MSAGDVNGPFLAVMSPRAAAHLVAAIDGYQTLCRRNGMQVPDELVSLSEAMSCRAMWGQPVPNVEMAAESLQAAEMDVTQLTYRQAAVRHGCSERTLKRRVAAGDLPAVKNRGLTRLRVTDLDDYFAPERTS